MVSRLGGSRRDALDRVDHFDPRLRDSLAAAIRTALDAIDGAIDFDPDEEPPVLDFWDDLSRNVQAQVLDAAGREFLQAWKTSSPIYDYG